MLSLPSELQLHGKQVSVDRLRDAELLVCHVSMCV